MAEIKCKLKDGKLEVLHVEEFQPGDKLLLDKPTHLFHNPRAEDCLFVKRPFSPGRTFGKEDVDGCPGNKPK